MKMVKVTVTLSIAVFFCLALFINKARCEDPQWAQAEAKIQAIVKEKKIILRPIHSHLFDLYFKEYEWYVPGSGFLTTDPFTILLKKAGVKIKGEKTIVDIVKMLDIICYDEKIDPSSIEESNEYIVKRDAESWLVFTPTIFKGRDRYDFDYYEIIPDSSGGIKAIKHGRSISIPPFYEKFLSDDIQNLSFFDSENSGWDKAEQKFKRFIDEMGNDLSEWPQVKNNLLSSYFPQYRFFINNNLYSLALRKDGRIISLPPYYLGGKEPSKSVPDLKTMNFDGLIIAERLRIKDKKTAEDIVKIPHVIISAFKREASDTVNIQEVRCKVIKIRNIWIVFPPHKTIKWDLGEYFDYFVIAVNNEGEIIKIKPGVSAWMDFGPGSILHNKD